MQNLKQQSLEIRFTMKIKIVMAQAPIFIHFCAVVLLFFVKTVIACLMACKEGWGDSQKNRNFISFLLVLLIFFLMCGWGLALAMQAQCSVVVFRCSSSLFHQYSGTKCCKTAYDKIPSTKSLSNNGRSVAKNLPSSSYKILFSR